MIALLRTFIVSLILAVTLAAQVTADDLLSVVGQFQPVRNEPVFTGSPGEWDSKIRERGWILKEGDLWRLWYTGFDPNEQPPMMRLGYATSADGLSWKRDSQNPLITDYWVEDMMVVKHGTDYFMFAEGAQDQAQLLRSSDGIHWTRQATLDIRLKNGDPIPPGPFGTPTAFFADGVWHLFYERRDAGIWLARSADMSVWTNVSDSPVLTPGPEGYDRLMIAMNQIIRVDNRYLAVLHGTGSPEKPRQWCTTLAQSDDLIHWNKIPQNPLRPVSENKSSGQLVHDGTRWRLYTMHDRIDVHAAR